jgi:hypothetical protein
MAAATVKALIESFPHPVIPPIKGLPTYESITDITRLLNANAASMHSELGRGALGHLALTISPAVYATLLATPFVAPPNPGPTPVLLNNGTAAQISATIRDHKESLRIWHEYNTENSALTEQIIRAVNLLYIQSLQHRHTGFANITARQLIRHLLNTYNNITPTDLAHNDIKFQQAYGPAQPIESLLSQLKNVMDYAGDAGSSPYTAAQVVINAYSLVFSTGLFPEVCCKWRRRPDIDKTWAAFKEHFAKAHHDLRLAQGTTQEGGYHSANNAMDSFVNETADAFANLATATASDRQMLADLTAINKELTTQLAAKDREISTLRSNTRTNDCTNDCNSHECNPSSNRRRYNNTNYCWTHCYDVAKNHSSQTCLFPGKGHKRDANQENIMNCNVHNKAKVM